MCGFANTLIFSSILSFTSNNVNITPLDLIVGYPSNAFITWKERKNLNPKIYIPLVFLIIIGIIPGVLFLKLGNAQSVKIFFGFVIIFIALEMFFRERAVKKSKSSKIVLILIALCSGLLCGLFGIGALLAAYMSRTTDKAGEFRGNLCIVFFIENTFRIILYFWTGILNFAIVKSALMLIPFMLLGLGIGNLLSQRCSDKFIKKAVIILLILSGVSLIINNAGVILSYFI